MGSEGDANVHYEAPDCLIPEAGVFAVQLRKSLTSETRQPPSKEFVRLVALGYE